MPTPIERDAQLVLSALASEARDDRRRSYVEAQELQRRTGLRPANLNDTAEILVETGLIEWLQALGSAPFRFIEATITPRGRYELERMVGGGADEDSVGAVRPPSPVGSPFGFTDHDWKAVEARKARGSTLSIVAGYQFKSSHYDSCSLVDNLESMFRNAVSRYSRNPDALPIDLEFKPLAAGYGEHLFNEIARDIIAADIGVFETSDLNPNVMLEMGVALTWGVSVLPIKVKGRPKPPSDISGQTWADYTDSAATFDDPGHESKLVNMIERAAGKRNLRVLGETQRTHAQHQGSIQRVVDRYLDLVERVQSSGPKGMIRAGVLTLTSDADVRKACETIQHHGVGNPIAARYLARLQDADLRHFFKLFNDRLSSSPSPVTERDLLDLIDRALADTVGKPYQHS